MNQMLLHKKEGLAVKLKTKSEAKREAEKMFEYMAKRSTQLIDLLDLQRLLGKDDAEKAFNLFLGNKKAFSLFQEKPKDKISKTIFIEWMVRSYKQHRSICLSLEDTDGVSNKINTIANIVLALVLVVVVGFPLLGLGSTHPLFFQIVIANSFIFTYLFGLVWKSIYDCMVMFYVIHPFDVDDECEIDGREMVVERMSLNETVFIGREDKKRHIFPNTVLRTKSIMNNTRSDRRSWNCTTDREVM